MKTHVALAWLLSACAAQQNYSVPPPRTQSMVEPRPLVQGLIGVSTFDKVERSGGNDPGPVVREPDLRTLPLLGGVWQQPLGGERLHYGIEGGFSFGWDGSVSAFALGGGLVVAFDNDLFLLDLFLGPYVGTPLGDKWRLYGGVGPLLQFADFELNSQDTAAAPSRDGSGFGYGYYARTGIEYALSAKTLVGLALRWIDSKVDLSGGLGDLDVEGVQAMVTVSQSF